MRGIKRELTEEEIQYIVDHWGTESSYRMEQKFGCSWYVIRKIAVDHDLPLPSSNKWTDEEVEMLKELSDTYHYSEIAKMMNRSENAILLKSKKLGITLIQDHRKWTEEEEVLLSDSWGTKPIEEIAKVMKRTVCSLKVKAVKMGLGTMIDHNYDLITVTDMCNLLQVPRDRITSTWIELGLKLKKKKLSNQMSYYVITWNDLMEFLENNQNEWDSRLVEKNMLGIEPLWLKEKRIRDKEENPLWRRKWTEEEIAQAEKLFKMEKSYQEIGAILNRSPKAIGDLLRSMGYSYLLPQFWKGKELKYLREHYENMTYEEIADVLGRTTKAVATKAEEMGYQKLLRKSKGRSGGKND